MKNNKRIDMDKRFKIWPDYENCISNLPNSVMRYFGVETKGKTLPILDRYLKGEYRNVIVLLLDGMGINIMKKNLSKDGFFMSHLKGQYSSTFPPTTVAATTSVLSGQMPNEHGWLGWDCYYPQIDKNVTVFLNVEQETGIPAADYNVSYRYCPYENVIDRLKNEGVEAHLVAPFIEPYPNGFEMITDMIKSLSKKEGRKYIYAYFDEPDTTMHKKGCFTKEAIDSLSKLEQKVNKLCSEIEDSLLIVTADHGHIDSRCLCIEDYPDIMECLVRMPSIEPRALNLFIKPDKKKEFEESFNTLFGDDFVLMTKEEVMESKLFGTGTDHIYFKDMLGDYLAVATGDTTIFNTKEEADTFIGVHAGLTTDEMAIPLIVIDTNEVD